MQGSPMTVAEAPSANPEIDLVPLLASVAEAAGALRARAVAAVAAKVGKDGKIDNATLEAEEHAAHGLSWIATYVEALKQAASYASRMTEEGRFGEMEALVTQIGAAEYATQLLGGVIMSQNEIVRAHELGVAEKDHARFLTPEVRALIGSVTPATRARAIALIRDAQGNVAFGDTGLDETME